MGFASLMVARRFRCRDGEGFFARISVSLHYGKKCVSWLHAPLGSGFIEGNPVMKLFRVVFPVVGVAYVAALLPVCAESSVKSDGDARASFDSVMVTPTPRVARKNGVKQLTEAEARNIRETNAPGFTESSPPSGATLAPESSVLTPTKMVDTFFRILSEGKVGPAYETLLKDTKIAEATSDVAKLRAKTGDAISSYGAIRDWELISSKKVGRRMVSLIYLSYGASLPLRWKFYYYNQNLSPEGEQGPEWKLVDIRIDDRFIDLFDDVAPAENDAKGDSGR